MKDFAKLIGGGGQIASLLKAKSFLESLGGGYLQQEKNEERNEH